MLIQLNNAGKQYQNDWIFRKLDLQINAGDKLGITGPNGSGKSTLLKILSGQTSLSKGERLFKDLNSKDIDEENVYQYISFAAPYIELIEEFTLMESVVFYNKFRKLISGITMEDIILLSGLKNSNKPLKSYSSGMKQRVKLLLALCFEGHVIILDEPSTNLDDEAKVWTEILIKNFLGNRSLIIASNENKDFAFVDKVIDIRDYKS